jgi:hypothetical protein
MTLLLCGLAGFFASQLVKTVLLPIRPVAHWLKPILALGASLGVAAVFYSNRVDYLVVYGVAGAGLAVIAHKIYRLFSIGGDVLVREMFRRR